MSNSTGLFYDGDYRLALPCGPAIFEQPFDQDPGRYVYSQEFVQFLSNYVPGVRGAPGPSGGFLAKESTPEDLGGGLVKFKRWFAKLPSSHQQWENFAFNYQWWQSKTNQEDNGVFYDIEYKIAETPLYVPSLLQFDYFNTTTPGAIPVYAPKRFVIIFETLYVLGDTQTLNGMMVAEASQLHPWVYNGMQMANIMERVTRYVNALALTATA